MKEFFIVFQIGQVPYLVGNHFYTASILKNTLDDGTVHYEVNLHDKFLGEKFGTHHSYYFKVDHTVNWRRGESIDSNDLHAPILKALEVDFTSHI